MRGRNRRIEEARKAGLAPRNERTFAMAGGHATQQEKDLALLQKLSMMAAMTTAVHLMRTKLTTAS